MCFDAPAGRDGIRMASVSVCIDTKTAVAKPASARTTWLLADHDLTCSRMWSSTFLDFAFWETIDCEDRISRVWSQWIYASIATKNSRLTLTLTTRMAIPRQQLALALVTRSQTLLSLHVGVAFIGVFAFRRITLRMPATDISRNTGNASSKPTP